MSEFAYLNGLILPVNEAHLNINDLGLLRGYGVFDFFRVIDGKPVFLEDYLDRFEHSLSGLNLKTEFTRAQWREAIFELIRLNPHSLLGIKIVSTGGYSRDGYTPFKSNIFMLARPFQFHDFNQGLKLMTIHYQRELPVIKSINYLVPISCLPQMKEKGADDVLYHFNSRVTESSRSNVFIIKDGKLITPAEGILLGITRKRILSFAGDILPVEVRHVSLDEVREADEVFLSASTKRISPVTKIDDIQYQIGPWTRLLYDKLVMEEKK